MSDLYTHQDVGAAWLSERARGYLGDTPGLGKTRTVIAALQRAGVERPLIVCPAIVRSHWRREMDTMDPAWSLDARTYSYDEITRGGNALMVNLLRGGVDALVLDEAHYLKHASSQRTKMLLGKDGYARRLPHVFLASGTPMPRNPAEMWPVLSSLFPEALLKRNIRTYEQFVERYCITRGSYARGVWREKVIGVKADALPELRELLGEVMLRRTLDDVGLDVPRIDWQVMRLDPTGKTDFDTYDDSELPIGADRMYAAIHEGTLADIANDPHVARMRRRLGELKAPLVVEMLREQLESGHMPVAVFAHHRTVLAALRDGLAQFGASYVDGDTAQTVRDIEIQRFGSGERKVFIGQNIACSTGMDGLQHATNRAVLVEPDWSADVNYQIGHRVARLGAAYTGRAVVQMIALAGTLDEAIVGQNARETRMVAAVYDRKEAA